MVNNINISIQHLSYCYRQKQHIVPVFDGLNLTIDAGTTLAITGKSGVGKSTLLNLLGCLSNPDNGQVLFDDKNIHLISERKRCLWRQKNLGFIYQFHYLLGDFNALDNVLMPVRIQNTNLTKVKKQAQLMLTQIGLAKHYHHYPSELSGGQRQRIAVIRSFIHAPKIILADEPTGNLDTNYANQVMQLLLEQNKRYNTTLIIATHDPKIVNQMQSSICLD